MSEKKVLLGHYFYMNNVNLFMKTKKDSKKNFNN